MKNKGCMISRSVIKSPSHVDIKSNELRRKMAQVLRTEISFCALSCLSGVNREQSVMMISHLSANMIGKKKKSSKTASLEQANGKDSQRSSWGFDATAFFKTFFFF